MKSIDVIHKFGHLYDRATKKRILIEDGSEISIVLQPDSLLNEDRSVSQKKNL
ncbi:hypothetical protein [Kordia sp.]|uniref:hypothetical protein n=1 Tax=Kordia sp. TaxID=1965332 RepID=UPI003D6C4B5C